VQVIQVRISASIACARFSKRHGHSASDLDEARVRRLAEEYPYTADALIVDGERPLAEVLHNIEKYVGLPSEGLQPAEACCLNQQF
jgi:thymidylate kinase